MIIMACMIVCILFNFCDYSRTTIALIVMIIIVAVTVLRSFASAALYNVTVICHSVELTAVHCDCRDT